jgi:hypothetical protein
MGPATRDAILTNLMELAKLSDGLQSAERAFGPGRDATVERVEGMVGEAVYAWNIGDLNGLKAKGFKLLGAFRQLRDRRGARAALSLVRNVRTAQRWV